MAATASISRRHFLAGALALGATRDLRASPRPLRLGGPVFVKSNDPAELAQAHRALGYRAAYAPADLPVTDTVTIAAWVKEFAKRDVAIAEVGAVEEPARSRS